MTASNMTPSPYLTVTVRSLHAQNDGAEVALRILLESGEHREEKRLLLTMEQYCDIRPQKGVISEEMYDRLEAASVLCQAIRSGENLLSYGANSAQMLTQKLMRRGFGRDVSIKAAKKLQDMGLINEQSDLRRELEKCLRKLWGAKRIQAHMWSKGFAAEAMAELPELLSEVEFSQNCAALICKHYGTLPTDPNEKKRVFASLGRYGYSISEIREAFALIEME